MIKRALSLEELELNSNYNTHPATLQFVIERRKCRKQLHGSQSFLLYIIVYYTYILNAHMHSLQTLHYTNSMKRRSSCFNNGADFTASWSVERYGNIPET